MEAIKEAYTPSSHVEFVKEIFDVKEWLRSAKVELNNITNPHCFVLKENPKGDVILKYKNWSRDKSWKPDSANDEGVIVLEVRSVALGLPHRRFYNLKTPAWEAM